MRTLDWFFAARPLLHLPLWSIYLVAHHYFSPRTESLGATDFVRLVALSLLAAGTYYLNQVYDRPSDALNRKLPFLRRGVLSEGQMMSAFVVCSVAGLALISWLGISDLIVFCQGLIAGWLYSAPPARLKDRPWLGMIANAYVFGVLVSLLASSSPLLSVALRTTAGAPAYFFFAVAATYLVTTIPDRDGDRDGGKRTVAVVWGPRATLGLSFFSLVAACLTAHLAQAPALTCIAVAALLLVGVAVIYPHDRLVLLAAKLPMLLLTVLAGWLHPWYVLIVVALILSARVYFAGRFGMTYPSLV